MCGTGLSPALVVRSSTFPCPLLLVVLVLQPQHCEQCWFGLIPVRSPLLGDSRIDFFCSSY